jgi:hypothetical protein
MFITLTPGGSTDMYKGNAFHKISYEPLKMKLKIRENFLNNDCIF